MARSEHIPVLASEVQAALNPQTGERYLDLTAGLGGHANLVLYKTGASERAVLVDRDESASQVLALKFPQVRIVHQDFLSASQELVKAGEQFDLILADLGVSSVHLNDASRGFSFRAEAPLDMRMDKRQKLTAAEVLNSYSEAELAEILRNYGQEPKARQIARLIAHSRPLTSTSQLADLAKRAWPGRSKIHPATRTFQAIRLEVNQELAQLEQTLPLMLKLLAPGGRLAIISFHSLEDRLIKQFLAEHSTGFEAKLELINKKPIRAGDNEIAFNPRSRSAKLRAAAKIKKKGDYDAYQGKR